MTITASIASIKNNSIRRIVWLAWCPVVTLLMISRFACSPNLLSIVGTANRIGWNGMRANLASNSSYQ